MIIRKAKPVEAQAIIDLHSETVRRINSRDYTREQIDIWLGHRQGEITAEAISRGEFYVAVDEEENLLGVGTLGDDTITGLYVAADHQGEGAGTALLTRMAADAGASEMEIESTLTAAGFYARMGFVEVKRATVGKAELEVVIMRKNLCDT